MPRTVPASIETHFSLPSTTYTFGWRVTPQMGALSLPAEGFTALDRDFTSNGLTYQSKSNVLPTQIPASLGLSVDAVEATVLLFDAGGFDRAKLERGYYNSALVELFAVNYCGNLNETVSLMGGRLGAAEVVDGAAKFELLPWPVLANRSVGRVTGHLCDCVRLGRGRCQNQVLLDGVDIADYTYSGTVSAASSAMHLVLSGIPLATGLANKGILRFTSGDNNGAEIEVKMWDSGGDCHLNLPAPYLPTPGTTVELEEGCDRLMSTCRDRFNNIANFRGFNIPGQEKVVRTHGDGD